MPIYDILKSHLPSKTSFCQITARLTFENILQSYTTPFAADINTVSVSVEIDIKLFRSCSPLLRIGPLTGVCVTNFSNVPMSEGSVFFGTFEDEFVNFVLNGDLEAGTYPITFDVINPLEVQDAAREPLNISILLRADEVSPARQQAISECQTDLFSPRCPEFLERNVRQSSNFAGDWNNITVNLFSTVRLVPPAVLTISGFLRTSEVEILKSQLPMTRTM